MSSAVLSSALPTPLSCRFNAATRALQSSQFQLEDAQPLRVSSQSAPHTFTPLPQPKQYTRTNVQGCVCKLGAASSGCCPSGAANLATQRAHSGVTAGTFGFALAGFGMYAGVRGVQLGLDALRHLDGVLGTWTAKSSHAKNALRAWAHAKSLAAPPGSCCAKKPWLKHHQAHWHQGEQVAAHMDAALRRSRREQLFNVFVPGVLQSLAATLRCVEAGQHIAMGVLGTACSAAVGALAGNLFIAYSAAMAGRDLIAFRHTRDVQSTSAAQPSDDAHFSAATAAHLRARQSQHGHRAGAWTAVAVASGISMAAGFTAAWPLVSVIAWGSALWAIWESTGTRYDPHIPISVHVDPQALATHAQRAQTWRTLINQDAAINNAITTILTDQPRTIRLTYQLESLFMPKCGSSAFSLLPRRIAQASGTAAGERYQRAQLAMALAFVRAERDLLNARFEYNGNALTARCHELDAALAPQPFLAGFYEDITAELQHDTQNHVHQAQALARLDDLERLLLQLDASAEPLHSLTESGQPTPWTHARLTLLHIQGTLADTLSQSFYASHAHFFSDSPGPNALPIHNVHIHPASVAEFVGAIAPHLDRMFPHAFMNPQRTAGEIDFIIDHELAYMHPRASVSENNRLTTCCN